MNPGAEKEKKKTILAVDDAPENLDVIKSILVPDYTLKRAATGAMALKIAESQPPDLILLDVMMPGMDGFDVCLQLKANPVTKGIPVVFVTALSESADEQRGFAVGGVDYINKPFQPELVRARVRTHLEIKEYRDDLERLVEERTQELSRTQDATIFTVANLAETRDPETGAHIMRTQHFVTVLAQYLSASPRHAAALTPANIDLLFKSAPLHDIGKVGIPDHILLKPGKLTAEEFEEMKQHAVIGWKTLNETEEYFGTNSFLRYACEISLTHHEKWDGSGYPYGLSGDAIPLSGRLMAVADVYDALTSARPYKKPFTHEAAKALIVDGRGKHFDPEIVDAFLALETEFQEISRAINEEKET
ncbi:MAG: two-component system response regulator [Alphaproteobacteria bacterium]|nr:two-component system response regulator [Alphaproteobacteria bacterium]